MSRLLTTLISICAIATLAFAAAPATACPRDAKAKGEDCPCKHMAKKAHAAKLPDSKAAAKASAAPAKLPAERAVVPAKTPAEHAVPGSKTTDLSPRPHVRMLEPLTSPTQLKLPEQARLDASAGVLI